MALLKTKPLPDPLAIDPTQAVAVDPYAAATPPTASAKFVDPINAPHEAAYAPSALAIIDRVLGGATFTDAKRQLLAQHDQDAFDAEQKPQLQALAKLSLALKQAQFVDARGLPFDELTAFIDARPKLGEAYASRQEAATLPAGATRYLGRGQDPFIAPKIDTVGGQAFKVGGDGVTSLGQVPYIPEYEKLGEGDKGIPKMPVLPPGFTPLNLPTTSGGRTDVPSVGPTAPAGAPRSVRNNNPGNIEDGAFAKAQPGYKGTDGRFAIFDTDTSGADAQAALLGSYGKRGLNTVAQVINRWAPASENDTDGYVKFVADKLGVKADQPLNMQDPATLHGLAGAIRQFEGGPKTKSNGPPAAATTADPAGTIYGNPKAEAGEENALTPDAVDLLAGKYISSGALPPLGMGKAAAANRNAILNRATSMAKDLGLNADDLIAGTANIKALGSSLTRMVNLRNNTAQLEQTAHKNADLMLSLAPKGAGPTNVPVLNRWIQAGRKNVAGDADVTQFDNALGAFSEEYAKVMTGNLGNVAATDSARHAAAERLGAYATKNQLQAGVEVMKTEMSNRMQALGEVENGIRANMRAGGRADAPAGAPDAAPQAAPSLVKDGLGRLVPKPMYDALQKYKGNGNQPVGSEANPYTILDDAHFATLPKGAHFVGPDGIERVKP